MFVAGFAPAIAMDVVGWSNGVSVALLAGLTDWAAASPMWAGISLALAILIGLLVHNGPLLYLVGTVILMAAFICMLQGHPYWLYATVLTLAIAPFSNPLFGKSSTTVI